MPASIKVGNASVSVDGDLASLASAVPVFVLKGLDGLLTKPLRDITLSDTSASIGLTSDTAFAVGSGADRVTFGFTAALEGRLALLKAQDTLFTIPAFDDGDGTDVVVPDGRTYLKIGFKTSLDASGAFDGPAGGFRLDVKATAGRTVDVINFVPLSPDQTLESALASAFGAFRFPFQADGVDELGDGHYILYTFAGTLGFAAGLSGGLSIAGRSLKEVTASADVPWLTLGARPTIGASARLGVSLDVTDHFQVIVGRERSGDGATNRVALTVSKLDEDVLGVEFRASLIARAHAEITLTNEVDGLIEKAAQPLLAKVPEVARGKALDAFKKGLGEDGLQKYIDEAQEHVDAFLEKVNGPQGGAFVAAYQRTRRKKSLCSYTFDFNQAPARTTGYGAGVKGDFLTALGCPGVDLARGSFLEDTLVRRTALTIKVFNVLEASDQTTFTKHMRTVYAGNGTFHVVYQTGGEWRTVLNAGSESVQMYFEVDADGVDLRTFSDVDVTLTYKIVDAGKPDAASTTLQMLARSGDADLVAVAEQLAPAARSRDFSLTVTAVIHHGAYGTLAFDPVFVNGQPNPTHQHDSGNYVEFVRAVNQLNRGFEQFAMGRPALQTYEAWRVFDAAVTGEPADAPANRKESVNLAVWPAVWASVDQTSRQKIRVDLEAGRQFMNLCECLAQLASQPIAMSREQFDDLRAVLDNASHSDYDLWFGKAMLLALLIRMNRPVALVMGSAHDVLVGRAADVSFHVGAA